jgi:hypothetical protein
MLNEKYTGGEIMHNDIQILRDLAAQVAEISRDKKYEERRDLWRKHNSLKRTRIPVYANVGLWDFVGSEVVTPDVLKCKDPFYRYLEANLRCSIFKDSVDDDDVIEPWVSVFPVFEDAGWGVTPTYIHSNQKGGANKVIPPIKELEDINKLKKPIHKIDEVKTKEIVNKAEDAIGDIITIDRSRGNQFGVWAGDISALLGQFLGIEELMIYMYDRPEWLHSIAKFLMENIKRIYDETEEAGDWTLTNQYNQGLTYCEELPDPKPNSGGVSRKDLWCFFLSQEFTLISPEMQDEFLIKYQMPLMKDFGLIAYGCCEDLTHKIKYLKKIPNLRRVSASPWADVKKCAEQVEDKYVLTWRPSPSLTISNDWDPERIRKYIEDGLEASRGCYVDITLKDVQTVRGEIWRLAEWVKIVKDISSKY